MVDELKGGDRVVRGICDMQKAQPFFAHLVMNMSVKELPKDAPMQTMGVDAVGNIFYADGFVDGLSLEEMQGVLAHETMHIAMLHMERTGSRHVLIANLSQDIVVNMMVSKAGLKLPMRWNEGEGVPVDVASDISEFAIPVGPMKKVEIRIEKVSEKSWEEVYREINIQLEKQGASVQAVQKAMGFDEHMAGMDGETKQEVSKEEGEKQANRWRENLANAMEHARRQGNMPAGMERLINDVLKPKVKWKDLLRRYLKRSMSPVDWSYHRPSRRSYALDVFMPTVVRENCELEVIIDTSGSISDENIKEFLGEVVGMSRAMGALHVWVSFCDTKIQSRYELDDVGDILKLRPKGGGGTDMESSMSEIKELNPSIPVVCVLTDGYTSFNKSAKSYPFDVIWCLTREGIDGKTIPYGHVVKMD